MTISIAWRRHFAEVDEIIFASDSRLSAGYRWDCAQKIFPIDGPNFCISFSGSADFAFPCIFQFQCMIKNFKKSYDGAEPIDSMCRNFVQIVNQMKDLVDDQLISSFIDTKFLIFGFNFRNGLPFGKQISYCSIDNLYKSYRCREFSNHQRGSIVGIIGDETRSFLKYFSIIMQNHGPPISYQPVEALRRVLNDQDKMSSIGGAIQIVKVYRHRNYLPYAVRETEGSGVTLFGRPLMKFEKTLYPIATLDRVFDDNRFVDYPMAIPQFRQEV